MAILSETYFSDRTHSQLDEVGNLVKSKKIH